MHIRSKFDGGKQINRSQSGSWEARCAGAALGQNLGPQWGPEVWEVVTGRAANSIFKVASEAKCKQPEADRNAKQLTKLDQADRDRNCNQGTEYSRRCCIKHVASRAEKAYNIVSSWTDSKA